MATRAITASAFLTVAACVTPPQYVEEWVAVGEPELSRTDAARLCEAQAQVIAAQAGAQAKAQAQQEQQAQAAANARTQCFDNGAGIVQCRTYTGGGFAAGFANAMAASTAGSNAEREAGKLAFKGCMAQRGYVLQRRRIDSATLAPMAPPSRQ